VAPVPPVAPERPVAPLPPVEPLPPVAPVLPAAPVPPVAPLPPVAPEPPGSAAGRAAFESAALPPLPPVAPPPPPFPPVAPVAGAGAGEGAGAGAGAGAAAGLLVLDPTAILSLLVWLQRKWVVHVTQAPRCCKSQQGFVSAHTATHSGAQNRVRHEVVRISDNPNFASPQANRLAIRDSRFTRDAIGHRALCVLQCIPSRVPSPPISPFQ
jgi:hypothetical protein